MGVRRLHALDLLERERLYALLRVGLEAVLDVGGDQLAPVERRHVLPLDPAAQLEGPHALVGAPLPRLGEVSLEREIAVPARLVGEHVAQETIAGQPGELEQADRLREPRVDHRRIPGRGPGEHESLAGSLGSTSAQGGIEGRGETGVAASAVAYTWKA